MMASAGAGPWGTTDKCTRQSSSKTPPNRIDAPNNRASSWLPGFAPFSQPALRRCAKKQNQILLQGVPLGSKEPVEHLPHSVRLRCDLPKRSRQIYSPLPRGAATGQGEQLLWRKPDSVAERWCLHLPSAQAELVLPVNHRGWLKGHTSKPNKSRC